MSVEAIKSERIDLTEIQSLLDFSNKTGAHVGFMVDLRNLRKIDQDKLVTKDWDANNWLKLSKESLNSLVEDGLVYFDGAGKRFDFTDEGRKCYEIDQLGG
jgi:hypothetical protein